MVDFSEHIKPRLKIQRTQTRSITLGTLDTSGVRTEPSKQDHTLEWQPFEKLEHFRRVTDVASLFYLTGL